MRNLLLYNAFYTHYADEDNIGSKLMSQMGWEKGKGLGLNEQGSKDPVKVRQNMESRGRPLPLS